MRGRGEREGARARTSRPAQRAQSAGAGRPEQTVPDRPAPTEPPRPARAARAGWWRTVGGAALLLLAACAPEPREPSPEQQAVFAQPVDAELVVPAERNALAYTVTRVEAPAGATVRLVMDNTASTSLAMIHNVVVVADSAAVERVGEAAAGVRDDVPLDEAVLVLTPLAGPGERTAVVFTMPPPGEYPFICTYPGHYRFMQGVLVSTPPEVRRDTG
ncbi:plastocyanin/azurin family copper-binding protein [Rubrivirga litoralis]|uniref:Plastocyanin/azurin family copper-binding protein n=1 Tax=Rubrivirga litoralis TaxID=3075598 RepID=A0ABU3BTY8_9BACT|nr:plastocyanin/azurin family copper-binding protein [Rubrivirga sp. F394]MDT0632756.1 plastocyanin/azurin family copper-binding protein [Rubrivirga sp. F394]